MSERPVAKPFLCRIGVHDWQAVPPDLHQPAPIRDNPYVVEMQCCRCGKRKIEALNAPHDVGE